MKRYLCVVLIVTGVMTVKEGGVTVSGNTLSLSVTTLVK